jgi:carboxyl-terminal processing protease
MKKQTFKNSAKFAVCVLLCLLFGAQSLVFAYGEIERPITEIEPIIDELLDLYLEYSFYDLTREEAIVVMLRNFLINNPDIVPYFGEALLTAFDPYGGYYSDTTPRSFFSSVYRGFGIVLGGKTEINGMKYHTVVDRVFDESPAQMAGLLSGDEIIELNGANVEGLGVNAVSHLISVCPDQITITVRRGREELSFMLAKDTVFAQSVSFYTDEAAKTAVITINDFLDEYMVYDIYEIMEFLDENDYRNVIVDLRKNPGGELYYMLNILNMFIPDEGVVTYAAADKNGELGAESSTGHGIAFDKICVLTDGASASAAEVLALSLRDIAGAFIIGEKTFGKGIGQLYTLLSNGDVAAITTFEILSANKTSYHGIGIEPDIKIPHVYTKVEKKTFGQLNFVNCKTIQPGASSNAVLALNQRLAAIGYITPEDVTAKCTDKTIAAVEIFQKYNGLPVGISKIDYTFIEYLDFYAEYYFVAKYEEHDVQLECAEIYIQKGEQAAKEFAEKIES